jgi:CRP/FNR family nitrogen fixation transcriptional regulator
VIDAVAFRQQRPDNHRHDTINRLGTRKRFTVNAEIYGADEPADYFYKVANGCVRSNKVVDDGRRLIAAFHVPSDISGLGFGERHLLSAEAVTDAEILVVNRNAVMSLADREPALARDLWAHMADEVHRAQSHLLLLKKSARERVATFLLEMAEPHSAQRRKWLANARQM